MVIILKSITNEKYIDMNKRILEFLIKLFFHDWKTLEGISGIIVGLIAFLIPNLILEQKIKILIIGFFAIFLLKIIKQFFNYFLNYYHPIKVKRKVQGDGAFFGLDIIVLEFQENVSVGTLLTLYF